MKLCKSPDPDLWAFWEIGTFPYLAGGKVHEFNTDHTLCRTQEFGPWLTFIQIVPAERGERIAEKLSRACRHYRDKFEVFRNSAGDAVKAMLEEEQFTPSSRTWTSGMCDLDIVEQFKKDAQL